MHTLPNLIPRIQATLEQIFVRRYDSNANVVTLLLPREFFEGSCLQHSCQDWTAVSCREFRASGFHGMVSLG